jgi:pullulanase/glycogen debranching enzyme
MADRVRMNTVSLATTALAQTPSFWHAGADLLRSKSLDRNSFNSGDWFNLLDLSGQDNGFGRGLPPAADNEAKWPYAKPLLADGKLVPGCDAVTLADVRYRELLQIRKSSPVFGLPTAAEVQKRLSFPLSGAAETPGVITMHLDGRGLDRRWKSVTVVFNATPAAATQTVAALKGASVGPHPLQHEAASFDRATGTFTVPARTTAVFVQS